MYQRWVPHVPDFGAWEGTNQRHNSTLAQNLGDHTMKTDDQDRLKNLLKQALLPVKDADNGPGHDLWPTLLARMEESIPERWPAIPLLDWALLAGLAALALFAPASIPVLLYNL